ncbi:MAG: chemotaxis protein CheR [Candidatus Riflebacteria bacterium]|nr:chemotaxis protein CheR [Candidatus Riflebacteria bacterium]
MAFTFFFRDLHTLEHVVNQVVPLVAGRSNVRVWNAGCAMGMETYTLAILFAEKMGYFAFKNLKIDATDIDGSDLFAEIINSGTYPNEDLQRIPQGYFEKYFKPAEKPGHSRISELIRSRVTFRKHDLLTMTAVGDGYSLIVCKNVLLHFTPAERVQVMRVFYRSLAPQGLFAVEQTQVMPDEMAQFFERVVPDAQLFRKIEVAS